MPRAPRAKVARKPARKAAVRKAAARTAATELSREHRAWIVENLVAGVPEATLATQLATQLPAARARREVAEIAHSPLLATCRDLATRARRLELVAAIGRAHARHEPEPTAVERRTLCGPEEFFRTYWAAHRPVVFTNATAAWPALGKWTPAFFREELGKVPLEITDGRTADPRYDQNHAAHKKTTRMDRFIDRVLAAGTSNDLYMVAHNNTMLRPAFRALLDDVIPPPGLFEPLEARATSLWIGPAGTVTPLHHDTTNILFNQLHGRKRFELISPQETVLVADPVDGFYSPIDLDDLASSPHPAVRELLVKTVELSPGDSLYIPAGWWHRVTSLDVSISFSLLGFVRPNDFDWYRPGHAR